MPKQKYYAVKVGRKTGIFTEPWDTVKTYIDWFSGAQYKSFKTRNEAQKYIKDGNPIANKSIHNKTVSTEKSTNPNEVSIYVDGSFNQYTNEIAYAYSVVDSPITKAEKVNEPLQMHNVLGEIVASEKAITWAINQNYQKVTIFYDYLGIAAWANNDWKTNNQRTKLYKQHIDTFRKSIDIAFTKVAAHTGIDYNEQVDKLAKAALGIHK